MESSIMRHVLSAFVQNVPGVLAHVAGMFASRGYNIDSLAVGETEDPQLSRMTFVVVGDDSVAGTGPQTTGKNRHRRPGRRHQCQGIRRTRPDAAQGKGRRETNGPRFASCARFSAAGSSTWLPIR